MRIIGFLLLPLWSIATLASAQVGITHDALTCMSTNEFPMVEAELDPAELGGVRKAHVYFKANRTDAWYFVEMEPGEGSELRAILPRPLAETNRVDYYVFVLSGTFEPWQTEEYSVQVSESGCEGGRASAASGPTSLILRATVANQAPVPPGFQALGISGLVTTSGNTVTVGSIAAGGGATSGGVSGITIGAVAAGGAAAAVGVAVASGGDSGNDSGATTSLPDTGSSSGGGVTTTTTTTSPSPSPTPSPTPAPMPTARDVSGLWILDDRLIESCEPSLLGRTSRTGMTIQQNGTTLTASRQGPNFTENLSGTIDAAGKLSMRGPFTDEGEPGESNWEASTTSDSQMTGQYTRFYPAHNCTLRWTFSGSKT